MADLNRKRSRKTKLIPRECDDILQDKPIPNVVTPWPPIDFDIKVEIESCDEDSFQAAFGDLNEIKEEPKTEIYDHTEFKEEIKENDDLFEAEEHDIAQMAQSLARNTQESVIKKEREDDKSDQEQKMLVSTLGNTSTPVLSSGKRKRVPKIQKEYVYNTDDENEEINSRPVEIVERKAKVPMKKTIKTYGNTKKKMLTDINKKAEMLKQNAIAKAKKTNLDEIDNEEDEYNPETKSGKNCIRQLKISDEIILDELNKISGLINNDLDKMLAIEMRNLWGRAKRVRHNYTEQQKKILSALEEWRSWCQKLKTKEPPVMYKCYICEKAWWHFSPFSEHVDSHHEPDLLVKKETNPVNFSECYIIATFVVTVPKFFPIEGNCWQCGYDIRFHSSTLPSYRCQNCVMTFSCCREFRDHHGYCSNSIAKSAQANKLTDIKLVKCSVCDYKILDIGAKDGYQGLEDHMKIYHHVRSDVPVQGIINNCRVCSVPISLRNFHYCVQQSQNYECKYCNRRHPSRPALDHHLSTSTDNYVCEVCKETLPKSCMKVKHMVNHSKHFGLMLKCWKCTDNVLFLDEYCARKHKVVVHKQKYDKRRNCFEGMLVPNEFIWSKNIEKLNIVRSSNKSNKNSPNKKTPDSNDSNAINDKTYEDDDGNDCVINDDSQNMVVEINELEDNNEENVSHNEIKIKEEKFDDDYDNYDDELFMAEASITKASDDDGEEERYESMLYEMFNKQAKPIKVEIKEEMVDNEEPDAVAGTSDEGLTRADIKVENEEASQVIEAKVAKKRKRTIYQCNTCEFKGTLAGLKKHMREKMKLTNESVKMYNCSKCVMGFDTLREYCVHLTRHGYEPDSCPECLMQFNNPKALGHHIMSRAKSNLKRLQFLMKNQNREWSVYKYKCRKCKQIVPEESVFAHWEFHLEIREMDSDRLLEPKVELTEGVEKGGEEGEESDGEGGLAQPLEANQLKLIIAAILVPKSKNKKCMVCERIFGRRNDTKRHLIEHLLQDAYHHKQTYKSLRCQVCTAHYRKADEYKLHMRSHALMPVYQCPRCGKTFSDSSNYTKHKKTHDIAALLECNLCQKKFCARISLEKHMELHDREPIKCAQCPATFFTQGDYKRHVNVTHDRHKVRYTCVICKKKFKSIRERLDHNWLKHKQRLSQADCPLCPQAYRKHSELKRHLKVMHDMDTKIIKPFLQAKVTYTSGTVRILCPICEKNFSSKLLLVQHMYDEHLCRKKRTQGTQLEGTTVAVP